MRNITILFVLLVLFLPFSGHAQDSLNVSFAGSWQPPWGICYDVAVQGNYTYVADFTYGLRVVDVSDPTEPCEMGLCDHDGQCYRLAVAGNYAYVAAYTGDFRIVDISDPCAPVEVGWCQTDYYDLWPVLQGDYVYLATGNFYFSGTMTVIDVSDPTDPQVVSAMQLPGHVNSVAVSGQYAFAAIATSGIYVIDISDPANPVQVAFLLIPFPGAEHIELEGDHLYLVDLDFSTIRIVDISDPLDPVVIGYYFVTFPMGVCPDGDILYVVSEGTLHVLDISDPSQPALIDIYSESLIGQSVVKAGSYIYNNRSIGGLNIIDAGDPAGLSEISRYQLSGWIQDCIVVDAYAYLKETEVGMRILDVTDLIHPVEAGLYECPQILALTIAGDLACVAEYYKIHTVDISDPAHPVELGSLDAEAYYYDLEVAGSYLYTACASHGLIIIDIENPANPVLVDTLDLSLLRQLEKLGDYLYARSVPVTILDISDPGSPFVAATLDTFSTLAVNGDFLVTGTHQEMTIYDNSDPLNPVLRGSIPGDYQYCKAIDLSGHYLYITDFPDGLTIWDIADPGNPSITGFYETGSDIIDIAVADGYSYLSEKWTFSIYDCSQALPVVEPPLSVPPAAFALFPPYPNPANPTSAITFSLSHPARVQLALYNVIGKEVGTIWTGFKAAGYHTLQLDTQGLSSGIYLLQLQSDGRLQTQKWVVLK